MSRIDAILRAFAGQPWAIEPGKLEAIREFLELRAATGHFSAEEIAARIGAAPERPAAGSTGAGVAVIPIYGVISQRAPMLAEVSGGGGASTEAIGRALDAALQDPQAHAILFDVDSPGGAVSGVPELAAKIRNARGQKPMVAIANTAMNSAAYWIASAADEVVASPSATVGSIGVYTVHHDISGALAQAGVKPTVIKGGRYKAEGADGGPLSEEALAALEAQVLIAYGMFVDDVAASLGTTAAAVRAGYGEGRALFAKQALESGLVHRVATFDETVARIANPRRAARIGAGRNPDVARRRLALDALG